MNYKLLRKNDYSCYIADTLMVFVHNSEGFRVAVFLPNNIIIHN